MFKKSKLPFFSIYELIAAADSSKSFSLWFSPTLIAERRSTKTPNSGSALSTLDSDTASRLPKAVDCSTVSPNLDNLLFK